ncbi:acyl-CoA dehydrogenase family protein [Nocardioides sp. B-3]|uniref:acyl-CoA dehydrogenase family protein n=1 Tax=Nocardioides sp. B-3 TaxID=2895565 RepID=UPI00215302D3|nr:acyl-CoA dehydrogenase family protein [Nocardioides sp. B-3]UUZ60483.1 acyl-CoA dehydrogenase family protein [Nocardioides sp. B-3]
MTAPAHAPVVSPTWTSEDAVSVARTLAAHFAEGASRRDAERILPGAELDRLAESGLLAITVPQEYGGP